MYKIKLILMGIFYYFNLIMYFVIFDYSNFQCRTGLNILNYSTISFTDIKNIHAFYNYGFWIRPVVVPSCAKITKDIFNEIINKKWYSNKIILGDGFLLYDLKTIKKFNLNITDFFISEVCKKGKIDILEWWKNSGLELKYDTHALEYASENGHINVLEWWKNSGLELKYDTRALNYACQRAHINVLEWWKNSGLELKYTESALYWASKEGYINVLEWWKNSGLELKYTEYALELASEYGHINVLEWWKNSGLELKYDENALNVASRNGHVEVLEWWKNSGLELKVFKLVPQYSHIEVWKWWKKSGLMK